MKWCCFRPLLCILLRLNLPLSQFEPATQWSEVQHATAGPRRPPMGDNGGIHSVVDTGMEWLRPPMGDNGGIHSVVDTGMVWGKYCYMCVYRHVSYCNMGQINHMWHTQWNMIVWTEDDVTHKQIHERVCWLLSNIYLYRFYGHIGDR